MTKCPLCKETKYIRYTPVKIKGKVLTYIGCTKCCYCKLLREEMDSTKIEDLKETQKIRKDYA
jgi:hypothetical protein